MDKVILTEHLDEAAATWLAERVDFMRCPLEDIDTLNRELADAAGLIVRTYTKVDDALLDRAPKLRVVARAGVGLDNIDLDACHRRGIRVVYTPDANTQAVVEYVWALIFDVLRPRVYLDNAVTSDIFHNHRTTCCAEQQLGDLTLGILGMGRIGRRVAAVAQAFGMNVMAHDLLDSEALGLTGSQIVGFVSAEELRNESDILTIHVDGRSTNYHLVDTSFLADLKPECVLINTSRGMLVNANSLSGWARRAESMGGCAILDVHDPEPPPPDYPLWNLPNVRLLPHLASRTSHAMANMSWVVRDVVSVLRGEVPKNAYAASSFDV